jgi:FixJ family two-component response regulator
MSTGEKEKVVLTYLLDDNQEFSNVVTEQLSRVEDIHFKIVWLKTAQELFDEIAKGSEIGLLLLDYYLPDLDGLEVLKKLHAMNFNKPVVFLTINKNVRIAIEAMKLGAKDFLIKGELSGDIFIKTLRNVIDKQHLWEERAQLEIRARRLEAIQEVIVSLISRIEIPLNSMKAIIEEIERRNLPPAAMKYFKIIEENLKRIETKKEKLKSLKEDKTVRYIKNITMVDIS